MQRQAQIAGSNISLSSQNNKGGGPEGDHTDDERSLGKDGEIKKTLKDEEVRETCPFPYLGILFIFYYFWPVHYIYPWETELLSLPTSLAISQNINIPSVWKPLKSPISITESWCLY